MASRPQAVVPPWQKQRKAAPQKAPPDMVECAVGCYIWGQQLSVMLDVMVLANSFNDFGVKASRWLCTNEDTLQEDIAMLMNAFWEFVPVQPLELLRHLKATKQKRLQGDYSKL